MTGELERLNQECMKCMEGKRKRMEEINPLECQFCPIGKKVHQLEGSGWDKIDWNSSRWEQLYRH